MSYPKPWKSYFDQLAQLEARGMRIDDRELAADYLHRIGYYRLSGYWFAFRERSGAAIVLDEAGRRPQRLKVETLALDTFKPGTSFQRAIDLYIFDKRLRMLAMDALERLEIALRVDISHTLGRLDAFAYLLPELFHASFSTALDPNTGLSRQHAWLGRHAQLINRSREEFVRHNKARYGVPLAIWVACETWDFGTLSTLYGGMREIEQDEISRRYGIANGRIFATWLRSLNYLRNVCAHHGRLWNRNIVDQPRLPAVEELPWLAPFAANAQMRSRCFLLLCMSRHLLGHVCPRSSWPSRLRDHLLAFPDLAPLGLGLDNMGVPADWQARWP